MTKTRILVVDDNWPVAKLVAARLEKTGHYDVRVEHLPFEAVESAREFEPELFLLDVDMPGKNGMELASDLRRHPAFRRTPVLFLTSLVSAEEAGTRELASHGHLYLSKSASITAMHTCIERILHGEASISSSN